MGDACQDTNFKDIGHVTSRFLGEALKGSDLEIELSFEVSENGRSDIDPHTDILSNSVYWCFYNAHIRSKDGSIDVGVEVGRTLYDKKTGSAHRWDEMGDCKVMGNVALFCEYIEYMGASGKIISDSSTLFDEVDTLEGLDIRQAMDRVRAAKNNFIAQMLVEAALEKFHSEDYRPGHVNYVLPS